MNDTMLQTIATNVVSELTRAQKGGKSSFPFILHELSSRPLVSEGETFQVLVIGGSVYKSALLTKKNGKIRILSKRDGKQPVFTTREEFLSFASAQIDPTVAHIGVNFAFPLIPFFRDGRLDGKLGHGTKEHAFGRFIGKVVGEALEEYVAKTKKQKVKLSIANDTICLLLSGLTQYDRTNLAAGIVGTGLNFAMFLPDGTAVNLEAANFDKFPMSEAAKVVDRASQQPGGALFEKEIAGAYLHQVFNEELKRRGLKNGIVTSTDQLDTLAEKKNGVVSQIAAELLRRSAELVACEIAGITKFYGKDSVFNMEGSLFWKGWHYKDTVTKTVKQLVSEYKVTFAHIPDSGIMGAAKLVA